ncbi:hypothetical protein [Candidatus Methanarcanum hacksteinii]|uniref:hypothetical protein n=1 Tax=Candidatus Methanarcanum hacksteinii TaxID=2911857 RepID=UPI0037DCE205
MVNTKAVIAIAVVAILAMGGIGVAIYNMGDNSGNNVTIDSVLPVYGNANNDDRIDQADIDIINDIINGKKKAEDYPLANAKYDDKIDQEDIEQVKAIINKTATSVWHVNTIGTKQNATESKWPITSALCTATPNVAAFLVMLGITDKIAAVSYGATNQPDHVMMPEMKTKFAKSIGKSIGITYDQASPYITSDGVSAVITSTNATYMANYEDMEAHNIDVIRIDATGPSAKEFLSAVIFLGFMFDKNDNVQKIVDMTNKIYNAVNKGLDKVEKKVVAMASNTTGSLTAPPSDYTKLLKAAGAEIPDDKRWTGTIKMSTADWIYDVTVNKVVCMRTSGGIGGVWYAGTHNDTTIKGVFDAYNKMDAYKNNEIYMINGELPMPLRLAYVAQVLYPEQFNSDFADKFNADWCKDIYGLNLDFSKLNTIYKVSDYKAA